VDPLPDNISFLTTDLLLLHFGVYPEAHSFMLYDRHLQQAVPIPSLELWRKPIPPEGEIALQQADQIIALPSMIIAITEHAHNPTGMVFDGLDTSGGNALKDALEQRGITYTDVTVRDPFMPLLQGTESPDGAYIATFEGIRDADTRDIIVPLSQAGNHKWFQASSWLGAPGTPRGAMYGRGNVVITGDHVLNAILNNALTVPQPLLLLELPATEIQKE
jgi:hypothetical protein